MADPKWVELAKLALGTLEIPGKKHNEKILQFFRDVGHPEIRNDETAWCAAFAGSCLERAGIRSTRKLTAKSYLSWGKRTTNPKVGTICVFHRGNPSSWQGHVGFYISETPRYIYVLGGNQKNSVSIAPQDKRLLAGYRDVPDETTVKKMTELSVPEPVEINDPAFHNAFKHVVMVEGGFSDHPHDPGGETYKGILLTEFARYCGTTVTEENKDKLIDMLVNSSEDTLKSIYWRNYWVKASCDELPDGLSLYVFDTAVLHGKGIAVRVLQQALGVKDDGEVGPATLTAAEEADAPVVLKKMRDIRIERLKKSDNWPVFGKGWTNRIEAMLDHALLAAGYSVDDIRKIEGTMDQDTPPSEEINVPPPPEEIDDKFWLRSVTVWGAIVTIASVALPEIGKLMGFSVTTEEIKLIGEHGSTIIQSLISLIGAIMVVYGRIKEREPIRFGLKRK